MMLSMRRPVGALAWVSAVVGVLLFPLGAAAFVEFGPAFPVLMIALALVVLPFSIGQRAYRAVARNRLGLVAVTVASVLFLGVGIAYGAVAEATTARVSGAGLALGACLVGAWAWSLRTQPFTAKERT